MAKLKPFQLLILYACIFLGIVGLLIFAFVGPRPNKSAVVGPTVIVWGTLPQASMDATIKNIEDENSHKSTSTQLPLNIKYTERDPTTFRNDLLEAIAAGETPDVIISPLNTVLQNKNIVQTIPFATYPERTFRDTFIDEANLYKSSAGYFALPFAIDPIVMFYNKTILTSANIVSPPDYWDEVISDVPKLTIKDVDSKINRSAISLGEYRNLTDAKAIVSALLLQSGTTITTYQFVQSLNADQLQSTLYTTNGAGGNGLPPAVATINFFTQFADPTKTLTYTWNRALPESLDYFASGNLAMYLGYGSEVSNIESKNPNLNFDMSFIPEERSDTEKTTYGNLYGLSILKNSKNSTGALQAIESMTSNDFLASYQKNSGLPPVRRDLLTTVPSDAFSPVLYESALKAKGWLDPDSEASDLTFTNMIETVLRGQSLPNEAASRAQAELKVLTDKIK